MGHFVRAYRDIHSGRATICPKTKNHFVFIFLLAPQQVLLLAHFTSAFLAIMFGQYPDGYTPDGGSAFIFVDQVWLLMVVVLHTFEYIEAL